MLRVSYGNCPHPNCEEQPRIPTVLTPEEIAAVLRAAGEGRHGVRDHAMLLTLYHHGLRVSELCRLTLADLDLEGRRLWVERLNRGRSGVHPVPEDEARALAAYLDEREVAGHVEPAGAVPQRAPGDAQPQRGVLPGAPGRRGGRARAPAVSAPPSPIDRLRSSSARVTTFDSCRTISACAPLAACSGLSARHAGQSEGRTVHGTLGGGRRRMTERIHETAESAETCRVAALESGRPGGVAGRRCEARARPLAAADRALRSDLRARVRRGAGPALRAASSRRPATAAAWRASQEDERFHHWGLCQHLLAESQRAVSSQRRPGARPERAGGRRCNAPRSRALSPELDRGPSCQGMVLSTRTPAGG